MCFEHSMTFFCFDGLLLVILCIFEMFHVCKLDDTSMAQYTVCKSQLSSTTKECKATTRQPQTFENGLSETP